MKNVKSEWSPLKTEPLHSITEGEFLTRGEACSLNIHFTGIGRGRVTKNLGKEIEHVAVAF